MGYTLSGNGKCTIGYYLEDQPQQLFDYSSFTTYSGIQVDPLGKTSEQYHVRKHIFNTSSSSFVTRVFYRVKDLAPVYELE